MRHKLEPAAKTPQFRLCSIMRSTGLPCWATLSEFSGGGRPTRNSYSSSTSRSNMHWSPVGWPGPAGPAGPVQFPPLLTPAAPTSASFASPSALIPWAIDKGEELSLDFKMSGINCRYLDALARKTLDL